MSDLIKLPPTWCTVVRPAGLNEKASGLYQWEIEGAGVYVGKFKRLTRPTQEYARNVTRLLNKQPYRANKLEHPFRRIHRELAQAHRDGREITLTILANVDPAEIKAAELALIRERGNLNDPPFGKRVAGAVPASEPQISN